MLDLCYGNKSKIRFCGQYDLANCQRDCNYAIEMDRAAKAESEIGTEKIFPRDDVNFWLDREVKE